VSNNSTSWLSQSYLFINSLLKVNTAVYIQLNLVTSDIKSDQVTILRRRIYKYIFVSFMRSKQNRSLLRIIILQHSLHYRFFGGCNDITLKEPAIKSQGRNSI